MSLCASFLPSSALVLRTPAACRFLTPPEFVQLALSSYYAASHAVRPPEGEPWLLDGAPWSSPEDFKDQLLAELDQRLWLTAIARGYAVHTPLEDLPEFCAVGAAHGDALDHANPLFLGPPGQELPATDPAMHDPANRSAIA